MRVKTILFDNDGVLVDTEELYYQATKEAFASLGLSLSREEHERVNMSLGRSSFELALARGAGQADVEAARVRRDALYLEILRGAGDLSVPGVKEALKAMKPGRVFGIVTSCKTPHFKAIHEKTGLLPLFDFVIGQGDYEFHKPHPEPYLNALKRAGGEPAETLVVEDAARGVESAVAAGLRCAAIPRGISSLGDFSKAWRIFASMGELRIFLEGRAANA